MIRYALSEQASAHNITFELPRPGDAGFDIRAAETITLFSGEQKLIRTGLFLEIEKGFVGIIKDRSSLASKQIYTHGGVIDSSYRGEVSIILENRSKQNFHIEPSQRIAQILFIPAHIPSVLNEVDVDELTPTDRGSGGFGSTGR